jgi:hypothetical protein
MKSINSSAHRSQDPITDLVRAPRPPARPGCPKHKIQIVPPFSGNRAASADSREVAIESRYMERMGQEEAATLALLFSEHVRVER